MQIVDACPVCDERRSSLALEPNSLILLDRMRQSHLARYDYSLCHGCGVVYATHRPVRADYDFIYENFSEFLGRPKAPDIFDDPSPLDGAVKAEIDRFAQPYWSSQNGVPDSADRISTAARKYASIYLPHAETILDNVDVAGMRVLDVRSKTGIVGAALKRAGAREVCATVMFPAQEYLVRTLYGVDARLGLNFETFDVPFDGEFDLIVLTHMMTHAMRPRDLLEQVAGRLRPGGYVYLCQDNDDQKMYTKGKNLIGEMKPFHFQQFDIASLCRCLEFSGFSPVATVHPREKAAAVGVLARRDASATPVPIGEEAISDRMAMYRQWRDESVIGLPLPAQLWFSDREDIVERALKTGIAREHKGQVVPARKVRLMHEAGFAELNAH